jgi:hypothetical protein
MEGGHDMRTAAELLDHADVSTTMAHAHSFNRGGQGCAARSTAWGATRRTEALRSGTNQ